MLREPINHDLWQASMIKIGKHEQIYRFVRPEVEGLHFSGSLPEVMYETLKIRR